MNQDPNKNAHSQSIEDEFLGTSHGNGFTLPVNRLNSAQQEKLFQSYLTVFFRYKILIASITLVVGIAATYVTLRMPKQFTAHAVVSLGSYLPNSEVALARMLRDDMQSDNYIQDKLFLFSSLKTANTALVTNQEIVPYFADEATLPETQRDKNGNIIHPEYDKELLKKYLSATGNELIRGSSMIRVIGRATNPEMSAKIANAQAHAFVKESREELKELSSLNLKALIGRTKEKEQAVEEKREAIRKYVKKYAHIISPVANENLQTQLKLQSTIGALSSATLSRATSKRKMYDIGTDSSKKGFGLNSSGRSTYIKLQKNQDELEEAKRRGVNINEWWLAEKQREIELAKSELVLEQKQKKRDAKIEYLANVEREEVLKKQLKELNSEISGKRDEQKDNARIKLEYNILMAELSTAKMTYSEILKTVEQARLAGNTDLLTVKVVNEASVPGAPSSPNVKFNILLGFAFGLMLSVTIAYVLAFADNTVRTSKQLAALLGVKILGIIPSFSYGKLSYGYDKRTDPPTVKDINGDNETSLLVLEQPESLEAESFRSLRTMILHSMQQATDGKVLLVTSGLPLDGKSTVIGNLAVSYGKAEDSTLLIEGDLRRPSLHKKFGLEDTHLGLSDYLVGKCEIEDIIIDSPLSSLKLILAGRTDVSSGELLGSKKMKELIETLSGQYERVLLDSPPLSQISDALLLSKYSDGVLLVVRSGQTPKPVAEYALSRLQQISAPVIGTVLNDLSKDSSYGDAEYYSLMKSHYYRK